MSNQKQSDTTLLDVYAGMAMQTLLDKSLRVFLNEKGEPRVVHPPYCEVARWSFDVAEEMLAERAKRMVPA